ncbi:sigma-70 family RNA polymerase sigma factor [Carnobacterium divergens]|uniref:sigma-70 family RNA polymerase sigma factor n=1 Tax=Carnobacterium divergens TaxID=2748 RepID=UPI0007F331E4|nr:sigma-70 family RNA polymerase sigma factor [Carnobacterium divergens]SBO17649.1 putative RNA polymerase sigma factor [Carnobacterium divergens]
MSQNDERINAQLTKYFEKVIRHAAINYYKKKSLRLENEILEEDATIIELMKEDTLKGIDDFDLFSLDTLFHVEDEKLNKALINLTVREKLFLIEKFVSEKNDRQIGEVLHISRQGVTNLKHRLYQKLRKSIKSH